MHETRHIDNVATVKNRIKNIVVALTKKATPVKEIAQILKTVHYE
jgi:hypothetical protein